MFGFDDFFGIDGFFCPAPDPDLWLQLAEALGPDDLLKGGEIYVEE